MNEKPLQFWSPGVIIVVIVMLIAGWQIKASVLGLSKTYQNEGLGLRFDYPGGWAIQQGSGYVIHQVVRLGNPDVRISVANEPAMVSTGFGLSFTRNTQNQNMYMGYKRLEGRDITVNGFISYQLDFAYVVMPPGEEVPPKVLHTREILIPRQNNVFVISFTAPEEKFRSMEDLFKQILNSVTFG